MKRCFAVAVVAVLCSALFSAAVCEGAESARWSGTDYVLGPCPDPSFPEGSFQDLNLGRGVSQAFGKSSFISVSCGYFDSETTVVSSGWTIITAANGDTVHMRIEGTLDLATGEFVEHEEVLGGTGRFTNATGEIETRGTVVFPTEPNLFPYGSDAPPSLIQEPTYWVGSSEGSLSLN